MSKIIDKDIIISITTIPVRKAMLEKTLPYLINQEYYTKLCINIDNNLTKEDYDFYDSLKKLDKRIEINKECDPKWRSANKLLPTIKKYPEAIVITMDDDLSYGPDCVKELVDEYLLHTDCIIAHEINPVTYEDGELRYVNTLDVMLKQKEFGKYLSHSCLFPPHVFDGTDVFDYDKMMELTNGTHDELWFWEQTTLKGIKVIGLDWTISMGIDSTIKHEKEDYQLTNINASQYNIDVYNFKFNTAYGKKIREVINKNYIEFYVTRNTLMAHVASLNQIKVLYGGFNIVFFCDGKSMKNSHIWYLNSRLKMNSFSQEKTFVKVI